MGHKLKAGLRSSAPGESGADEFPETETGLLQEAAAGRWATLIDLYLRPCWREVIIECRTRRIPLADSEDLFQELVLRLMQQGRLNSSPGAKSGTAAKQRYSGNVAAKYLIYRELSAESARFRTVIKSVIRNLILEHLRRKRRGPRQADAQELAQLGGWIDQTISSSVDRHWVAQSLREAAERLKRECDASKTRGSKRLFTVLARSVVEREPAAAIAAALKLDRTTVSELLSRARERFVQILEQVAGVEDYVDLKRLVATVPEMYIEAVRLAAKYEPISQAPTSPARKFSTFDG
jgi:DNA-directed RNA polymerase specialized sigma24 family protein